MSKKLFHLSQLQHIIRQHPYQKNSTTPARGIKPHIDYASVVSLVGWLWRSSKKTKLNSLHRLADKLILPDPSLSTVTDRAAKDECTWNFKPTAKARLQLVKGIFMRKGLNNNSPNYRLAQLLISHQSHYTNSRNKL